MSAKRHLLIVNPHAGGGQAGARLKGYLAGIPTDIAFDAVWTEGPGHATVLARDAAARYETLVAVGGDGTACEVATGLLESEAPDTLMGILPSGTGNDAAHGIGVPNWSAGLAALRGGAVRPVDVCETTYAEGDQTRRRCSLVGAGVGYPAEVVARADGRAKRILRQWAYYYGAFAAASSYRSPTMRIVADGRVWEGRYILAAVANVEKTGGQRMRMAPGARCDDGLLHVLLIREARTLRLLSQLPRLAAGTHLILPEVEHFTASRVTVTSDPAARLNIDGDLKGATPASFRLRPAALRVRVPDHRM